MLKNKPSKAQAVIIQFTLFFLAGLAVFIMVGMFFRTQTDMLREDIALASLKLSSSYINSLSIASLGCKECDTVRSKLSLSNTTAGYFIETSLSSSGIKILTAPASKQFSSSMHNLNESLQLSGHVPSVKPISLTFNRTQNKLEISET